MNNLGTEGLLDYPKFRVSSNEFDNGQATTNPRAHASSIERILNSNLNSRVKYWMISALNIPTLYITDKERLSTVYYWSSLFVKHQLSVIPGNSLQITEETATVDRVRKSRRGDVIFRREREKEVKKLRNVFASRSL